MTELIHPETAKVMHRHWTEKQAFRSEERVCIRWIHYCDSKSKFHFQAEILRCSCSFADASGRFCQLMTQRYSSNDYSRPNSRSPGILMTKDHRTQLKFDKYTSLLCLCKSLHVGALKKLKFKKFGSAGSLSEKLAWKIEAHTIARFLQ